MSEALHSVSPQDVRQFIANNLTHTPFTKACLETFFRTTNPTGWVSDIDRSLKLSKEQRKVNFLGNPNIQGAYGHFRLRIMTKYRDIDELIRIAALLEIHSLNPQSNKPVMDVLEEGYQDQSHADLIICSEDDLSSLKGAIETWKLNLTFPIWHPNQDWIWDILEQLRRSSKDIDKDRMGSGLGKNLSSY